MVIGKLSLVGKKKTLQVTFTNKNGKPVSMQATDLSASLTQLKESKLNELDGLEVELEEVQGQPKQIRKPGEKWEMATPRADRHQTRPGPNQGQNRREAPTRPGDFHNPYNFIPAPPRPTDHGDLGDHHPVGHGVYHADRWSGRIAVKLTTITPLLIPDAANAISDERTDHKTYPLRVDAAGNPYLPPTSIKGMLRSAYEAVTNSRLSVFEKHGDRLAYRMPANIGLQMVPARIENDQICLYPGTSTIGQDGKPQGSPSVMYAAWLPRYERNSTENSRNAARYPDRRLPAHGERVKVWLEKYKKGPFAYWRVRQIVPADQALGRQPEPGRERGSHQPTDDDLIQAEGYVCITNKNIDRKHDERVFFTNNQTIVVNLTTELRKKWTELITNYQNIHETEIDSGQQGPPALNHSKWSRHITGGQSERHLTDGTLCYAHVRKQNGQYEVLNLYPVMITRGLFSVSPANLLAPHLHPATSIEALSPADRVFGWVNQTVNQTEKGSYKGNLRVSPAKCMTDNPVAAFGNQGVPLAILGQPKPQQFRFYAAATPNGESMPSGTAKDNGFKPDKGLRGRKVYPHHQQLPSGYWENPTEDRTQRAVNGHYQEYRRPLYNQANRDNQNRSIQAWVKPGSLFEFTVDITNLSNTELGGLLWLLTLPENHYHRLGGGKPFGFGSVRVEINWHATDLRQGQQWAEHYTSLMSDSPEPTSAKDSIETFKTAVASAYERQFEEVSFIKAFLQYAKGFDDGLPTHYPRSQPQPNPAGEAFKWFVDNESNNGNKVSLPDLSSDRGLPWNPTH
jgi:CRISPR-associated protein (TIGR03986 family)